MGTNAYTQQTETYVNTSYPNTYNYPNTTYVNHQPTTTTYVNGQPTTTTYVNGEPTYVNTQFVDANNQNYKNQTYMGTTNPTLNTTNNTYTTDPNIEIRRGSHVPPQNNEKLYVMEKDGVVLELDANQVNNNQRSSQNVETNNVQTHSNTNVQTHSNTNVQTNNDAPNVDANLEVQNQQ